MKRRIVLLTVSVVIAAIGALLVLVYANGSSGTAEATEDMVEVLTATSTIDAGETASGAQSEGKLALAEVPRSSVLSGALTSVESMGDQVALAPIYPGEQILAAKFGTTIASHETLTVPKDKVAISVELSDPGRVAGFVTPGAHVAIYVTFKNPGDVTLPPSFTRILVPDVEVLGVGPTTVLTPSDDTSEAAPDTVPHTVLTVALDQLDSDLVTFAATNNSLSFGLLGHGTKIEPDSGVTQQDLLK